MPRRQWGEEAGRRYELAPSQWAKWLHAKTRSSVGGILGQAYPSWRTLDEWMYSQL